MKHKSQVNPEEVLSAYLAKKGMKLTNQRRLIVHEFFQPDSHWSAEELYQKIRKTDSSIGQATVYRTLNLLRDAKLARELRFSNDVTIFEPRIDSDHHDHLICEECGKTLAVLDERIEVLQTELACKHGYAPTSHRMYLYGVCPECQAAPKDNG